MGRISNRGDVEIEFFILIADPGTKYETTSIWTDEPPNLPDCIKRGPFIAKAKLTAREVKP
jgi:hypothetical protein